MTTTSRDKSYGQEQTPAQRQWQRERAREQEAYTRAKCNGLKFWQRCRNKACRRHMRCSGDDVHACWQENWSTYPDILKEQLKRAIWLMRKGAPPAEASRTARLELTREFEAKLARQQAAAAPADAIGPDAVRPADAEPSGSIKPPTPRVRLM